MVPQRILQTAAGLALSSLLLLTRVAYAEAPLAADAASNADAAESSEDSFHLSTIAVDLRPGDAETRGPSLDAFLEAIGMYGEFTLPSDNELNARLQARPFSAILDRGLATLSAAILSFGTLDCVQTEERAHRAALDFAAAMAAGVDARKELRQAHLYLFLCADRGGRVDDAMDAARVLQSLSADARPSEISLNTWQKYPSVDTQSNQRLIPVQIESDPSGADVWIDYLGAGLSPSTHYLSEGAHVVALGKDGRAISQSIQVRGKGRVSLKLPDNSSRWAGLVDTLQAARAKTEAKREEAMRSLMSATESDVAFVLREPGRIEVWIAPSNRGSADFVGHAPNAAIAGQLALQALRDAERAPGIDPNFPLLREGDTTSTRASSNRRWWVYGVVLGAAAIGAGIIVAQDLSEDRQRIEVSLP